LCAFKEVGILSLGTVKNLTSCLQPESRSRIENSGRGADDIEVKAGTNIMTLKWYDIHSEIYKKQKNILARLRDVDG
jgi:hypothetical protein